MLPYLILVLSALAAGAQNSLAGGGTLYTFPALEHFTDAVSANATSTVALVTGSVASAWGFRTELKPSKKWLWWLVPPCILGGTLGTWLVIHSAKTFETLVPWLILTASSLFLFQPLIARWVGGQPHEEPPTRVKIGVVFFQFIVGIYGGYFGAGIGILMISSLSLMGLGDIHRVNALKSLLAACINIMSAAVWVLAGGGTVGHLVAWKYVPAMAVAAIVGGYLGGARWSRRLNKNLVRWLVIAIGFGLTIYYFAKQCKII